MQRVKNFGSVMQAYSLRKMIESLGHEVKFIDIQPNTDAEITKITNKFSSYSECEQHFTKRGIRAIDRYFFTRLFNKIAFKKLEGKFEEFQREVLLLDRRNNTNRYDVCIIGSDEVFNCLQNTAWGFTRQLYGDVKNANKVITYAACAGNTSVESLPAPAMQAIKEAFQSISSFSVRDNNTKRLVETLTGEKALIHLDPVAVGDFEKELLTIKKPKLPEHYCIIYAYRNRIKDTEEINEILSLCKEKNLTPITIGGTQKWIKNSYILSPFEAMYAFKNADYVVTDTFHGAVFSVKYSSRFAIIVRDSNKNKLTDFAQRVGVVEHFVEKPRDITNKYYLQADRDRLDILLKQEYERTMEYLHDSIGHSNNI